MFKLMFTFRELLFTFDVKNVRVHLIKKETLEFYALLNSQIASAAGDWLSKIKVADWNSPGDIRSTFNSADLLGRGCNRVIFNLAGNNYRMICKYTFGRNQVHLFICWIGTHAEYNRICREMKQYEINLY